MRRVLDSDSDDDDDAADGGAGGSAGAPRAGGGAGVAAAASHRVNDVLALKQSLKARPQFEIGMRPEPQSLNPNL
jgi:hypothetical protein